MSAAWWALSIRQPWAWLIIRPDLEHEWQRDMARGRGDMKPVENRSWYASHRGPLLIHASKTFDHDGYEWVRMSFPRIPMPPAIAFQRGGIVGRVNMVDCVEEHPSEWFSGPFGFVFEDAEALPYRRCPGKLSFFRVEGE